LNWENLSPCAVEMTTTRACGSMMPFCKSFFNADKATPDTGFNPEVYYQLVGHDGDFIIGGDIYKLDFRPLLKNLKMPMLIIEGRYDRIAIPRYSVKFKEYAPKAKFVMFEKSGHNPYIEQEDKYFGLLEDFLKNGN